MMPRKRKNSAIHGSEGNPSKRAKLLADLWQSQETSVSSLEKSVANSSAPSYEIKAIIGENRSKYLIDWADDPITGEKFKPDWVSVWFIEYSYLVIVRLLTSAILFLR